MAISSQMETFSKREFKATCNRKTITIPLSVHKSQRNVFTVEKESEPIKKLADRICQYCSKEFRYPCRLKQHYKTVKCSDNISSQINQCSDSVSSQISQCSDS